MTTPISSLDVQTQIDLAHELVVNTGTGDPERLPLSVLSDGLPGNPTVFVASADLSGINTLTFANTGHTTHSDGLGIEFFVENTNTQALSAHVTGQPARPVYYHDGTTRLPGNILTVGLLVTLTYRASDNRWLSSLVPPGELGQTADQVDMAISDHADMPYAHQVPGLVFLPVGDVSGSSGFFEFTLPSGVTVEDGLSLQFVSDIANAADLRAREAGGTLYDVYYLDGSTAVASGGVAIDETLIFTFINRTGLTNRWIVHKFEAVPEGITEARANQLIQDAVDVLVGTAPDAFDTLGEIATRLGRLAPLDSPSLTGTPTVPTANAGTSTTQASSTEFVTLAIAAALLTGGADGVLASAALQSDGVTLRLTLSDGTEIDVNLMDLISGLISGILTPSSGGLSGGGSSGDLTLGIAAGGVTYAMLAVATINSLRDGVALLTGATFTGAVKGISPAADEDFSRKDYVDGVAALRAALTGAVFTGAVSGVAPTADAHFAVKSYVDSQTGESFHFTSGPPPDSLGADGDTNFDIVDSVFYEKVAGQWESRYTIEVASAFHFSAGAPAATLGNDGDIALDVNSGVWYGKVNGAWVSRYTDQVGAAGTMDGVLSSLGIAISGTSIQVTGGLTQGSDVESNEFDFGTYFASLAGATFTGAVSGVVPTDDAHLTRKDYVDDADDLKADLTGAVFTGAVQGIAPTADADFARKDYVDDADDLKADLTGATFTGAVSGIVPVADANFATKEYVDDNTGSGGFTLRSGVGPPADTLGDDDDWYLNTSDGAWFQKSGGVYGTAIYTDVIGEAGTLDGVINSLALSLTGSDLVATAGRSIGADIPSAALALPFLLLAGGTLTGDVSGTTPTADAHLTRKDYVDAADALRAELTGATFTGLVSGHYPYGRRRISPPRNTLTTIRGAAEPVWRSTG